MLLSQGTDSFFQFIVVLFIFVVVLVLCYFTTKWLAGYQKAQSYNKNLKVIETLKITNDKYISIIKASEDSYFVIGVGKNEINKIGELTKEQVIEIEEQKSNSDNSFKSNFSKAFENFKNQNKK